jgi:hypothetical protein
MATRKRKPLDKKMPAFKMTRIDENDENDLQKVKAQTIKELEEKQANDRVGQL